MTNIILILLNEDILKQMKKLQKEMSFIKISDIINSGLKVLIEDNKKLNIMK